MTEQLNDTVSELLHIVNISYFIYIILFYRFVLKILMPQSNCVYSCLVKFMVYAIVVPDIQISYMQNVVTRTNVKKKNKKISRLPLNWVYDHRKGTY